MQALDIVVEDSRWEAVNLARLTEVALNAALSHVDLNAELCEVTLLACNDQHIAQLNTDFRGKPTPTNVLSWPAQERAAAQRGKTPLPPEQGPDGMITLGDMAISFDTCQAEAAVADKPLSAHTTHLIVHGLLHLLGYDHIHDADAALMEGLEVEILGKLGLDDPY